MSIKKNQRNNGRISERDDGVFEFNDYMEEDDRFYSSDAFGLPS